jgi:hypothetical protein
MMSVLQLNKKVRCPTPSNSPSPTLPLMITTG